MPQMVQDGDGNWRHPWEGLYPMPLAEQKREAHIIWLWTRGEPPRYWDEEYYVNDPEPPSSLFDTARGYRHKIEIQRPIPLQKGLFDDRFTDG